jgi:beta-ureidopropionase / N-carbamoyl-L-amino-acid hydrolase
MDLSAMAIRGEEASSWFSGRHHSHFGSRVALGLLKIEELDAAIHVGTGQTLAQSMKTAGLDVETLRVAPPALSCRNVCGFIELHIEQGPVLVANNAAVGIVSAIRGTIRARNARCIGAYSHSGAVPQEMRRDAVLAAVEFINIIERHCGELRKAGADIVFAVGRLHTDAKADSLSKVPGVVNFTIDLRSQDPTVLAALDSFLDHIASKVGGQRKVVFEISDRTLAPPALMNIEFREHLKDISNRIGLRAPEVACGAGHDAAEFVRAGIPSCMIFVRNVGESHNPDERMDAGDFRDGALLLTSFLADAVSCRTPA